MKRRMLLAWPLLAVASLLWRWNGPSNLSSISFRIGDTFDQVVRQSSYPVLRHADIPRLDTNGFGVIWVSQPSVIITFNDPQFGFTLPPTTFAAVGFSHFTATSLRTSPSVKTLSFDDAFNVLSQLQHTLKRGGWQLEQQSTWFDLSDSGREMLRQVMGNPSGGNMQFTNVFVPGRYALIFGIRCVQRCESTWNLDRYLVDIGVGEDYSDTTPQSQ